MKDWENEFQVNFRKLVSESKLPLSAISRQTGIPNSTLNNWMHEKTAPRLDSNLKKLCAFFKIKLDDLVKPDPNFGKPVFKKENKNYSQFDLFENREAG
jgi:DNA-binding Xre family transcriptional regulator